MAQVLGIGGVFFKSSNPKGNKVELWQPPNPKEAGTNESDS